MGNVRFAAVLAVLVSVGVAAWPSVTQKTVVHGVTVAVTPGNLSEGSQVWDFAVAFDGRGKRLDDAVLQNFELLADGRRVKPLNWEGEQAKVGHRVGVLTFVPIQPRPKELQLQLVRPSETKPRVFRFAFGDWSA
jgi:hypothetical protein